MKGLSAEWPKLPAARTQTAWSAFSYFRSHWLESKAVLLLFFAVSTYDYLCSCSFFNIDYGCIAHTPQCKGMAGGVYENQLYIYSVIKLIDAQASQPRTCIIYTVRVRVNIFTDFANALHSRIFVPRITGYLCVHNEWRNMKNGGHCLCNAASQNKGTIG